MDVDWKADLDRWLAPFVAALRHKTRARMSSDEFVCAECFGDQGMKDFCRAHAESENCDFCGAKASEPIASPLDEVVEHITNIPSKQMT